MASAFNQPLSFDTSSVTTMHQMFLDARAFNQPLSFDTSRVTDMHGMFYVRFSPCPDPNLQSGPPLHAACGTSPAIWLLPAHTSPGTVSPPFDSRQGASAFNQPLVLDTSSVTNMMYMFRVRSARALCVAYTL